MPDPEREGRALTPTRLAFLITAAIALVGDIVTKYAISSTFYLHETRQVIGDYARRGRTVRFHMRDPESAGEDLRELLDAASTVQPPQAALQFSCNGRGQRLFREPNHDASAIQGHVGAIPVAGFFAAGEVGPVGGRNFLHGYTASIALFDEE